VRAHEQRVGIAIGIALGAVAVSLFELHSFRCPRCTSPFVAWSVTGSSVLDLFRRRCRGCDLEEGRRAA
jgi:hypothetical protein